MKATLRNVLRRGLCFGALLPLALAGCSSELEKANAALLEQRARAERQAAELKAQLDRQQQGGAEQIAELRREALAKARGAGLVAFELRLNQAAELLRTAESVKKEWDQINRGESAYDLVVYGAGGDATRIEEHEAALDSMGHVEVRDVPLAGGAVEKVRVGYSDVTEVGTGGRKHERHFRATWTDEGRKVGLSYYTTGQTDPAAFAALLGRLVPVVNRHITVKKGT